MNFFKSIFSLMAVVLLMSLASCGDDDNGVERFEGEVTVTLISGGNTEAIEGDAATFTFDLVLSRSFDTEVSLYFDVENSTIDQSLLEVQSPVIVAANQTTATLTIEAPAKQDSENVLEEDQVFDIVLVSTEGIDNQISLASQLSVKLLLEEDITPLTAAQQSLIEGYKEQGIDVSLWIGKIPVEVTIESPAGGYITPFDNAFTRTYSGTSLITLSDAATVNHPVLHMTSNAFGLSEYFSFVFKKETIENTDYWNNEYVPAAQAVLSEIGEAKIAEWENNEISFDVSVDSLVFNADNTISFVYENGAYSDPYDSETLFNPDRDLSAINFVYDFPLWTEVLERAKNDVTLQEHLITGGSLNPDSYLVYSQILSDDWWDGNWVEPTASFDSASGEMTYTFNFDHYNAGGYSIITVKYQSPFVQ